MDVGRVRSGFGPRLNGNRPCQACCSRAGRVKIFTNGAQDLVSSCLSLIFTKFFVLCRGGLGRAVLFQKKCGPCPVPVQAGAYFCARVGPTFSCRPGPQPSFPPWHDRGKQLSKPSRKMLGKFSFCAEKRTFKISCILFPSLCLAYIDCILNTSRHNCRKLEEKEKTESSQQS